MHKIILGATCALTLIACGQKEAPTPAAAPAPSPKATAAAPPPAKSGLDKSNFDLAVRAQDDLFRHANGGWLARTEIPADKSNYGSFLKLDDDSEAQRRTIIEEIAGKADKPAGAEEQKVGDLYASFMNEARAEALGITPLAAEFARVDALKDKKELAPLFAHYVRVGISNPVYGYVNQDAKVATQYIAYVAQARPYFGTNSGLGLPDRDYYLADEARFKDIRAKYVAHVEQSLALAGVKGAGKAAADILALETKIAQIQWSRVDARDNDKTYNKYDIARLSDVAPDFDWPGFLKEAGIEGSPGVVVAQPSYFKALDELIGKTPLPVWQAYFKWHVLKSTAPYLSKAHVDANFDFFGRTLKGIQEDRPRWKRGVALVEGSVGEAVGKIYVQRHFPPQAKARMEALVANLKTAYEQSIGALDWMSDETKERALGKLVKFNTKIGYPAKWRDYSRVVVKPDDLVGNVLAARDAEFVRKASRLGGPVDRDEWGMTPQTVNAYYSASLNEIVFPAAILQPPFFDMAADDAVNYGAIGAVIGHEIGHGFDDQGSKYDGDGNLQSWWTEADRKAFEMRTKVLIEQYNAFCPFEGACVNGALTIGENIGDLGGLSIAYKAYQLSLNGKRAPVVDGWTGDQRFFLGWAQAWQRKYREQELRDRLKTDAHSPAEYRCNGIVANLPEFYAAFGVKEGDKLFLAPEKRVKIW